MKFPTTITIVLRPEEVNNVGCKLYGDNNNCPVAQYLKRQGWDKYTNVGGKDFFIGDGSPLSSHRYLFPDDFASKLYKACLGEELLEELLVGECVKDCY